MYLCVYATAQSNVMEQRTMLKRPLSALFPEDAMNFLRTLPLVFGLLDLTFVLVALCLTSAPFYSCANFLQYMLS